MMEDASEKLLKSWYNDARQNIFGVSGGRARERIPIDISDDEEEEDDTSHPPWRNEEVFVNRPSSKMAVLWLRKARSRIRY